LPRAQPLWGENENEVPITNQPIVHTDRHDGVAHEENKTGVPKYREKKPRRAGEKKRVMQDG